VTRTIPGLLRHSGHGGDEGSKRTLGDNFYLWVTFPGRAKGEKPVFGFSLRARSKTPVVEQRSAIEVS
jgi:hypothetical protein